MPEGIVLASSNEADLDLFDPSPRMTRAFCALVGTVEVEREEVSSVARGAGGAQMDGCCDRCQPRGDVADGAPTTE